METNLNIDARLWAYIDGAVSTDEKSIIEKLLETDAAWKTKYRELLAVNDLLKSTELEQPSLRFTRNVMEEIARLHVAPATKNYLNKKIIWGIGIFFIVMLLGFIIYGFGQMSWTSGSESNFSKKISHIDYRKFFNNTWMNVLMMINVVIGLVLFDNYFTSKRKKFGKEA